MGPLQDLATLALAPLVREARADALASPDDPGHQRWLAHRLAAAEGELLRLVRQVCDRAWQALEVVLSGPELWERFGSATIQSPEQEARHRLLAEIVHGYPPAPGLALDERLQSLADLRTARSGNRLTGDALDAVALAAAVADLVSVEAAEVRRRERAVIERLTNALHRFGHVHLAQFLAGTEAVEIPLVVTAARLFLRLHVVRDPRLLWGPEGLLREEPVRRRGRALTALDDLQLHHTDQLFEWLRAIQEPDRDQDVYFGVQAAPAIPPAPPPPQRHPLEDTIRLPSPPGAAAPPPLMAPAPAAPMPARQPSFPESLPAPTSGAFRTPAMGPAKRKRSRSLDRDEEEAGSEPEQELRRRASVRWFRRMNPQRMYPLTVALAKGRIKEVRVKGVAQAVSAEQLVVSARNPYITVRPVLPGMLVYPPEQTVDVTPDLVTVRFQVLPQMLGTVEDARVELYWRQRLLSKIDLPIKVRKQTMAIIVSFAGLLWPFLGSMVKKMGGDEEPTDVVMRLLARFLSWPHAIEAGLAVTSLLAVGFYWLNRPKETTEDTDVLAVKPMSLDELLAEGRRCLLLENWEEARGYFEDAVNVAPASRDARDGLERARERRRLPAAEGVG